MKFILAFLLLSLPLFAQQKEHNWKKLSNMDKQEYWYDSGMISKDTPEQFKVWVLQQHKPLLKLEGIGEDIYRSKMLVLVNLKNAKYGIDEVKYYNTSNKEIFHHQYNMKNYDDSLKYTYPILENSYVFQIVKEFKKIKK